jgi:hypothetical protein
MKVTSIKMHNINIYIYIYILLFSNISQDTKQNLNHICEILIMYFMPRTIDRFVDYSIVPRDRSIVKNEFLIKIQIITSLI